MSLFRPRTSSLRERTNANDDDRPTDKRKRERDALLRERKRNKNPARSREKTSRCGKTRKNRAQKRVTYVSYLDDDAQTSRGWCNPPGASPDTINRSSRPRLSRAYRRCPELRSLTRTPFTKICKVISLDMCVRVRALSFPY